MLIPPPTRQDIIAESLTLKTGKPISGPVSHRRMEMPDYQFTMDYYPG